MADSVQLRLSKYARWEKFSAYLGGGLGGLVLFGDLAKDSFQLSPPFLRALFITLIVIGATALGRAYIGYVSASHKLEAWQKHAGVTGSVTVPEGRDYDYPKPAKYAFWAALPCTGLAAAVLIIASWWPVFSPLTQ